MMPETPMSCNMTLRDWYAGMAMQAAAHLQDPETGTVDEFAVSCFRVANAMLAERSVSRPNIKETTNGI